MTTSWFRLGTAMLLAGAAVTINPALAGPSMSSAWLTISIDQDACIEKGSKTMKAQSFTTRFEVLGNSSIYGERGDYTALIRCAADKQIVYFVVSGPTGSDCSKYMNAMRDNF